MGNGWPLETRYSPRRQQKPRLLTLFLVLLQTMRNNSQILHGDQTRSTRIGWLVYWHLTALSAQTGYIVPQEGRGQVKHTTKQWNNTINRESHTLRPGLYGDDLLASRHDYASFRSLSSQSFSKYWQFNQNNQRQNTYKRKLTRHKKEGPNKQQHTKKLC